MCAIEAGKRGRRVIVLEHNDRIGKKIRISGGGRCNFTNIHTRPANFISNNEHFVKSALSRFTPDDFRSLIEAAGIDYHEKKLGQLFCDTSAQQVIDMLNNTCRAHNVDIRTGSHIKQIQRDKNFVIDTGTGRFTGSSLVVATGGLSIPPLGATDLGYQIARQFDIKINPCRPGLVPLTMTPDDRLTYDGLSGVSAETIVSLGSISFRENTLFTHRGLSGPAILQISSYWKPRQPIVINWCPDHDITEQILNHRESRFTLKNFLKEYLPSRLAETLGRLIAPNKPLNQLSKKEIQLIHQQIHQWTFIPKGTEGYAKAEVTVGGVDTEELSSKTMEAVRVAGLYFIGEVVDVTGHLGGFNFQWAWASGYAAGQYV